MAVAENYGGSIPAVREERAETARGGRPAFAATAAACRVSGVDRMVSAPRPEGTVGAREVGAPAHSAAEAPENVAVREFPLLGNNTSCFQTPRTFVARACRSVHVGRIHSAQTIDGARQAMVPWWAHMRPRLLRTPYTRHADLRGGWQPAATSQTGC